jgi:hypothetical protein
MIQSAESGLKSDAFRRMMRNFYNQKVQESKSLGSEDKLQLVEKMSTINSENRALQADINALQQSLRQREESLYESEQLINNLSLRVNYFICEKFMDRVSTVYSNVKFRNLNDGYDAIIDEANREYQQDEQRGAFSDDDI